MSFLKFGPWIFLIVLFGMSFADDSFASSDPIECIVTIKSVLLKNDSGEWVTVIEPDHQVDLVSQEPVVTFLNNGRRVPAGKYINFKIILSEMVKVKGADGNNKTRTGGFAIMGGDATDTSELPGGFVSFDEKYPTWTNEPSDQGWITLQLNFNKQEGADEIQIYGREDFLQPLNIKERSFISVCFELNLSGTLHFSRSDPWGKGRVPQKAMYFLPPAKVEKATVTVDGQTFTISGESIRMAF